MTTDAELGAAARSILAEWAPGVNDFQIANRLSVALDAPADSPDIARAERPPGWTECWTVLADWSGGRLTVQQTFDRLRGVFAGPEPADLPDDADVARTKPRPIPELRYDPYSTVMHAFGEWLAGHLTAEDVLHRIRDVFTETEPEPDRYWSCRVGPVRPADLPDRADESLRRAVTAVFRRVVGHEPDVLESGWGHDG